MIKSVGQSVTNALDAAKLREGGKVRASAATSSESASSVGSTLASPAARMAAEGAPVDMDRIASIKAAIASGNYPVNAEAIAQKMLDLDLPTGNA